MAFKKYLQYDRLLSALWMSLEHHIRKPLKIKNFIQIKLLRNYLTKNSDFLILKSIGSRSIIFPSPDPANMSPFFRHCKELTPKLYLFFSGPIDLKEPPG